MSSSAPKRDCHQLARRGKMLARQSRAKRSQYRICHAGMIGPPKARTLIDGSDHKSQCLVSRASSTDRCNTFQCIDSTLLAREDHVFCCTRSKPTQGCVPAGPTVASDLSFCFQCQECSCLVLRRPIEITRVTGHLKFADRHLSGHPFRSLRDASVASYAPICRASVKLQ